MDGLEVQEQAEELGFSTTQEALDNGFEVVRKQNGEPYLAQFLSAEDEQDKAHEAWLKERFKVLADLKYLMKETDDDDTKDALKRAINFIEKGEC